MKKDLEKKQKRSILIQAVDGQRLQQIAGGRPIEAPGGTSGVPDSSACMCVCG